MIPIVSARWLNPPAGRAFRFDLLIVTSEISWPCVFFIGMIPRLLEGWHRETRLDHFVDLACGGTPSSSQASGQPMT